MAPGHDNPQTGPFYVDGAEPGDTLAIHIEKLDPAGPTVSDADEGPAAIAASSVNAGNSVYRISVVFRLQFKGLGLDHVARCIPVCRNLPGHRRGLLDPVPAYKAQAPLFRDVAGRSTKMAVSCRQAAIKPAQHRVPFS